jgi:hypothetical protein
MWLQILGSVGLGLVWGWLLGLLNRPYNRPRRLDWKKLTAIGAGFVALSTAVYTFLGWPYILVFLAASLLSFLAHRTWLVNLQKRSDSELR